MAAMDHQTITLTDRVQALPNEISDAILDLVLVPDEHHPTVNSWSYKPPVQLQIDHHSREKLATTYYLQVTFTTDSKRWHTKADFPYTWLRSLPQHHRKTIKHVRVERDVFADPMKSTTYGAGASRLLWEFQMCVHADVELQSVACNTLLGSEETPVEEKWLVHEMPWNGRYWFEQIED